MDYEGNIMIKSGLLVVLNAAGSLITTLNEVNVVLDTVIKLTSLISFVIFLLINWDKIKKGWVKIFKNNGSN